MNLHRAMSIPKAFKIAARNGNKAISHDWKKDNVTSASGVAYDPVNKKIHIVLKTRERGCYQMLLAKKLLLFLT